MDINPQMLQDFGPFALLPFAVLVIERLAWRRARDKALPESTRNRVYASAWVLIFALCAAVVMFWHLSRPREAMMRGKISGLSAQQRLRASGPETANVRVFTYRNPQQTDQLFWRTFSTEPLDERTELAFLIDNSTRESDDTWRYVFNASRRFYGTSIELNFQYGITDRHLIFSNPVTRKNEELRGHRILVAADTAGPTLAKEAWSLPAFSAVLMAQGKLPAPAAQTKASKPQLTLRVETVLTNLEADDPLIRLTARKQLASLGPAATKDMDKALASLDSSYRVKLGVIVAANQMENFRPDSFNAQAWCEIWRASQTGDDTLKMQASVLLKKQPKPIDRSWCRDITLRAVRQKSAGALEVYRDK